MMGRLITGGDEVFDAVVFGKPTQAMVNAANIRIEQARSYASQGLIDQDFLNMAESLYNKQYSYQALNRYDNILEHYGLAEANTLDPITHIDSIESLQLANRRQALTILASPSLKPLYLTNNLDGYSQYEFFKDCSRAETREAMNTIQAIVLDGVVDNNKHTSMKIFSQYTKTELLTNYPEEYKQILEIGFTKTEQSQILKTWMSITEIREESDEDPTDLNGRSLF